MMGLFIHLSILLSELGVKQRRLEENSPARGDSKGIEGKHRRAGGKSRAQWLPVLIFPCLESPRIYDEIRTR